MMKKTVLSFGEVLWDILPTRTILGGAPFNLIYRVNSLGDNGLMVSRLGRDDLGQAAFEKVVSLGLDTTHLQWDERNPTGTVQVSFDEQNNPDYVIIPHVAYDQIEFTDSLLTTARKADCLCFGTLAQRSEKSRNTLQHLIETSNNSLKFLDINLRKACYSRDTVSYSLEKANVLKLNEDEAHQVAQMLAIPHGTIPQFCEEMIEKYWLQYCLVTLAEKGAFAQSQSDEKVYSPGFEIELVDSLGSGDAFSAGFIYKILREASLNEACEFGNMLGALVATQQGGTTPITSEAINGFYNQNFKRNIYQDVKQFSHV